jgi:hypothetical protein
VRGAAALGRHSLSIFLYHYLFLIPFLQFRHHPLTNGPRLVEAQALLTTAAIAAAVAGSMLTAWALAQTWRRLRRLIDSAGAAASPSARRLLRVIRAWRDEQARRGLVNRLRWPQIEGTASGKTVLLALVERTIGASRSTLVNLPDRAMLGGRPDVKIESRRRIRTE